MSSRRKSKRSEKKEKAKTGGESSRGNSAPAPIPVVHETVLDEAVNGILDFLFDEFLLSTGTQFGREFRYGELEELGLLDPIKDEFKVSTTPGLDIFGQPTSKNAGVNFEIECPKCNRTLAAARFAQHLEKCMGMGRNSSRIAKRRGPATSTVTSSSSTATADAEAGASDEDDDEEWTKDTKERKKKIKKGSSKKGANSDGR